MGIFSEKMNKQMRKETKEWKKKQAGKHEGGYGGRIEYCAVTGGIIRGQRGGQPYHTECARDTKDDKGSHRQDRVIKMTQTE